MLNANLCDNGTFVVPGGLPVTLWQGGETILSGVLPKGAGGLTATVRSAIGVTPGGSGKAPAANGASLANVHLALYAAPTTSGGGDGALVGSVQLIAGLGTTVQTISVAVPDPTANAPATYVWRLWVDGLVGTNGVQVTAVGIT